MNIDIERESSAQACVGCGRPPLLHAQRAETNRPEFLLTNPPGHLWRDTWTALSGPLLSSTEASARGFASTPPPPGSWCATKGPKKMHPFPKAPLSKWVVSEILFTCTHGPVLRNLKACHEILTGGFKAGIVGIITFR